ncbi:MAG: nucleoside deaminase [Bacteroidales bacterium]|jgi:tRNA(adenine34) deaminase|nr:nucleoside deaminase [Bacteroidales bacterium]MCK9498980.1 nucleoside deaminase [Bacteroidales bacterium]MDY0313557.1 nucleoside deaminase [Bacteroidales bacterium]NLB86939.1 nucleoside deaminase [Bacteroidales bacterium]NLB87048.1 nucleoside deaminase [Bacteroidales bacterium]
MNTEHEKYMSIALQEAHKALEKDEVPIGAIIVCAGKIIGRGHNQTELLNDVTAHAEMLAITAAENYLSAKYLKDCTLYVSLEPCLMCAGALYWTQISNIVYGASDTKRGFLKYGKNILHPKTNIIGGILEEECSNLLIDFFKKKRK